MSFLPRVNAAAAVFLSFWIAFGDRAVAEWDYIVVGAGTTGCALSSQLASDASKSVLVLEAGGPMGWDFGGREQKDYFRSFGGNSNVTVFDVPGEAIFGVFDGIVARPEFWWETIPWSLQGKGVGGSGAVNLAVAFPASPEDFETWPEGWAYGDMKPFYKEVLDAASIGVETSADGELYLQAPGDALRDALINQLGFEEVPLNGNSMRVNTTSLSEQYAKNGQRFDSCLAFLLPALNTKDNIKLEVNSPVKRIVFSEPGLASGVELENGRVFHLKEGGKVVSTAGAFNTPKLLMYSGIGPALELERLDKSGLVHNPRELWILNEEVGAGFHDHPSTNLIVKGRNVSEKKQFSVDFNDTESLAEYFNNRSGPLAEFSITRVGFVALPGRSAPDLEYLAASINLIGPACPDCFLVTVFALVPSARDDLKISTSDLPCSCGARACKVGDFCIPDVYLANDQDVEEQVWATNIVIEALENEGFTVLEPAARDPASLRQYLSNLNSVSVSTVWHFAGACSMGRCTDENLKVKGATNVFVADASLFPNPVRTHNSVTAMAVGRKAASHISGADR